MVLAVEWLSVVISLIYGYVRYETFSHKECKNEIPLTDAKYKRHPKTMKWQFLLMEKHLNFIGNQVSRLPVQHGNDLRKHEISRATGLFAEEIMIESAVIHDYALERILKTSRKD